MSNKELAQELHKPNIKNFLKRNVQSPFIDNIWDDDLTDMQLRSKFNKGIRFLSFVIDIFSKYAWVIPLKNKLQLLMLFKKFSKNLITNQTKYG